MILCWSIACYALYSFSLDLTLSYLDPLQTLELKVSFI